MRATSISTQRISFRVLAGVVFGILVGCLAGCASTPKVSVDSNPNFAFAGKNKFAVLRPEAAVAAIGGSGAPVMNDLVARRLTSALEQHLRARGYQIVTPSEADMLVSFYVTTENRTDVHTYNSGFGYGRCWDPYRCAGWASPDISVQHYTQGTLYVDFIDPESKTLQWRGTTSKRLPSNPTQAERDELVNTVVRAIVDQYPPGRAPAS
jgi:hypothetical protein